MGLRWDCACGTALGLCWWAFVLSYCNAKLLYIVLFMTVNSACMGSLSMFLNEMLGRGPEPPP